MIEFEELRVSKGDVEVSFCFLGEGWEGDYDPSDPDDVPLLRFDVSKWDANYNEWSGVDDASYCTQLPVDTPHHTLIKLLDFILSQVYYGVVSDNSIKKMCEKLSWVTPDSVSYWGE